MQRFAPDVILFGGDFVSFTRHIKLLPEILLDGLTARDGLFAILGNHDYWAGADAITGILRAHGVRFITNDAVMLARGSARLPLAGIDEIYRGTPDVARAFAGLDPAKPCIAISHHPDIVDIIRGQRIDLLLCGHTHGGQIRFPFFGPVVVPSRHEGEYAAGFHRIGGGVALRQPRHRSDSAVAHPLPSRGRNVRAEARQPKRMITRLSEVWPNVERVARAEGVVRLGASDLTMTITARCSTSGSIAAITPRCITSRRRATFAAIRHARFPWAKSAIVILVPYASTRPDAPAGALSNHIARYALGDDYHDVLDRILRKIEAEVAPHGKTWRYVDTGPLSDRALATQAGLGWIAKNAMLINEQIGSYTFIGTLLTSLENDIAPDAVADRCGTCTRCLDACPTNAILPNRTVASEHCISYATIEHRGALPDIPLGIERLRLRHLPGSLPLEQRARRDAPRLRAARRIPRHADHRSPPLRPSRFLGAVSQERGQTREAGRHATERRRVDRGGKPRDAEAMTKDVTVAGIAGALRGSPRRRCGKA